MPLYGTLCLEVAKGPQPKLQPAFLPEKKCGEQFLEGGPIVRKLQLNHHIAQTETIRIFEMLQHTLGPGFLGEHRIESKTACVCKGFLIYCADVNAFHLFNFLCS